MEDDNRVVQLKRTETCGFGFSIFGGSGSGFPPVIYEVIEDSPAAISGELEAGDIILEVNDKKVTTLSTKEVLKCLRLSNDVITLKIKKDTSIRERIWRHMAASNKLEAAKCLKSRKKQSASTRFHSDSVETNGDRENDENIPPSPRHDTSQQQSDSDTDSIKSNKSQTRPHPPPPQPRFETFMMTGDLIINLNAKTSNSHSVMPSSSVIDNASFGQCSSPASPEDDFKIRNKATKRESSNFHSPVVEKKSSYNYSNNFVRTSKSEGHLQNVSIAAVDIDIDDDITTSLHTLLDTKLDNPANERIVWTYNAPLPPEQASSLTMSECDSYSKIITSAKNDLPCKATNEQSTEFTPEVELPSDKHNICSDNLDNALHHEVWVKALNTKETVINSDIIKDGDIQTVLSDTENHLSRTVQPKQDGITNIMVDENKIYVKVFPEKIETSEFKTASTLNENIHNISNLNCEFQKHLNTEEISTNSDIVVMPIEDSQQNSFSLTEDESDIDSLHSYHYSPKAVDMPSASRLAKRLYQLEGFKKSDVSRHLCKNDDFSRVVAKEYLKNFSFTGDKLDEALRKFLKQFCLIGETQERERVLIHFSQRFLDCNPEAFISQDAVHTLTCALMLLNTDLHGENIGRKMSCSEFIDNLSNLNDGGNFSKELLKTLYHSIKCSPLEWAMAPADDDDDDEQTVCEGYLGSQDNRQTFIGHNPFLEVPNPNCATEYKKGYVMRKCCSDPNGKRTPLGKRGWKMFYATLRDLVLYLHKDENGFRKNQLYDSLHNSIRVHHALATKASDYTKKQHVFRLQTADQAEYLFQTGDAKELQSWIDTVNYVAASLSSPPLPSAVGCHRKFQRPLLPVTHTKLNLREQLQDIENSISRLEKDYEEHLSQAPDKTSKSRIISEFTEKESYLQFELTRYKTYAYFLRSKMSQFPDMEPPLVETSIGEVDEPTEKRDPSDSPFHSTVLQQSENSSAKRSISDRYSYRAAIYKTANEEDCV